jgi:hypothetical protein
VWNGTSAAVFVQVFNLATGSVTLGTSTPDWEIPCAASTYCAAGIPPTVGAAFGTAISIAATTLEKGSASPGTGVQVWASYK